MLFTLEALDADFGDSLLVHCGTAAEPLLVVIDGGPPHVYEKSLRPRLEELRAERFPGGGPLPIEIVMLSHIDADHIDGLLAMTGELREAQDDQQEKIYDVFTLWHNSFDDITGNDSDDFRDIALEELAKPAADSDAEKARTAGLAVVASVAQGRALRDNATALGWKLNDPFENLVIAGTDASVGDTKLTVLCPHPAQLEALHTEWEAFLNAKAKKDAAAARNVVGRVAAYEDDSVHNLSSIVVLAEAGGKRMLLTGDARGDFVLTGLEQAGLLADDDSATMEIDILKLPHHGSIRNVEKDFFNRLRAKHYVISANGHDGNPETETLDLIVTSNPGNDDFTIYLTNDVGTGKDGADLNARITEFRERWKAAGRAFQIVVRDPKALGLSIHLGDEQP